MASTSKPKCEPKSKKSNMGNTSNKFNGAKYFDAINRGHRPASKLISDFLGKTQGGEGIIKVEFKVDNKASLRRDFIEYVNSMLEDNYEPGDIEHWHYELLEDFSIEIRTDEGFQDIGYFDIQLLHRDMDLLLNEIINFLRDHGRNTISYEIHHEYGPYIERLNTHRIEKMTIKKIKLLHRLNRIPREQRIFRGYAHDTIHRDGFNEPGIVKTLLHLKNRSLAPIYVDTPNWPHDRPPPNLTIQPGGYLDNYWVLTTETWDDEHLAGGEPIYQPQLFFTGGMEWDMADHSDWSIETTDFFDSIIRQTQELLYNLDSFPVEGINTARNGVGVTLDNNECLTHHVNIDQDTLRPGEDEEWDELTIGSHMNPLTITLTGVTGTRRRLPLNKDSRKVVTGHKDGYYYKTNNKLKF